MNAALPWGERLQETVGPIVVKEVRQGLRGRVFAVFFALLLTACLAVALVALAQAQETRSGRLGRDFLAAYLIALGVVCYFVIPYTAFRSLLREREDETWVLLVLTGLGARSIVRGKFVSAMSQALLFASACAPFVVFSYYLNGVDLIQVVLSLVMAAGWTFFLVTLALAVATQAESRMGRAFAHFLMLGLLGGGTSLAFAFSVVLATEGSRLVHEPAFLAFCAGVVCLSVGGGLLALAGAASGLTLSTEEASRGPRRGLVALVAFMLAFGVVGAWLGDADARVAVVGSIVTSLVLVLCGFFAISERDGWTRPFRVGGVLTKPGAARSFRLVLVLLAVSTGVWAAVFSALHGSGDREFLALFAAPLYVALYLSAGAFIGRVTPLSRLEEPIASRIGFALSTGLGTLLPPLLALFAGARGNDRTANLINPIVGMVNYVDRLSSSEGQAGLVLLGAATVLFGFLSLAVLHSRDVERTH